MGGNVSVLNKESELAREPRAQRRLEALRSEG